MKQLLLLVICISAGVFQLTKAQENNRDSVMLTIPVRKPVTKSPMFPDGNLGWRKFLEKTLDRDAPTRHGAPAGKYLIVASFLVDSTGKLKDIKIVQDPGYGTAEATIKALKKSPNWVSATIDGRRISLETKQQVVFMVAYGR